MGSGWAGWNGTAIDAACGDEIGTSAAAGMQQRSMLHGIRPLGSRRDGIQGAARRKGTARDLPSDG